MTDTESARIRALIEAQLELLAQVGHGAVAVSDAADEYRRIHEELKALLARRGRPCMCPWGSLHAAYPFAYGPGGEAVDEALGALVDPVGDLATDPPPTAPWTIVYYQRDGNPDDLPFADFEDSLSADYFQVLDESLLAELAVRGTDVVGTWVKGHTWTCDGPAPRPKVFMYKIEEGTSSGRAVLRVFFDTAPDHRIVLLHGFDKGKDDTDSRERAEAKVACERRADLARQLNVPTTAATALSSVR